MTTTLKEESNELELNTEDTLQEEDTLLEESSLDENVLRVPETVQNFLDNHFEALELRLTGELESKYSRNTNISELDYFRLVWQVYQVKYVSKEFWVTLKDLITAYKSPLLDPKWKQKLRSFILLCNTALLLNILWSVTKGSEEDEIKGELISEGYLALTEALEKYEVGFTHEKSTKNTTIKLLSLVDEGIKVRIDGNKEFANIDIHIKNLKTNIEETINVPLTWKPEENFFFSSEFVINYTQLTEEYKDLEMKDLKLRVSKKVWHPATFFTNSVYYSMKNQIFKSSLVSINSNSFILKNQILRLKTLYEEKCNKEPTDRWIAYYLLTQTWIVKTLWKKESEIMRAELNANKWILISKQYDNIEQILRDDEDTGLITVLEKNQNTKRLLMMRNSNAAEKNKNNYTYGEKNFIWDEDEYIYEKDFELKIEAKIKEIEDVQGLLSWVFSLDSSVWDEDGEMTLADVIADTDEADLIAASMEMQGYRQEILKLAARVLTPREYFYFIQYYWYRVKLQDLSSLGLYQEGSLTDIKNIIKRSFLKISYWTQYRSILSK